MARTALAGTAVVCIVLAISAACGGSGGGSTQSPVVIGTRTTRAGSPQVSKATFTATVEGATPASLQTRAALQQAATQTAQVAPQQPTQPPVINTTATATVAPNEVRPPSAQLVTSGGVAQGAIGSFNYYDASKDTGAQITAPYVQLADSGTQAATGAAAHVTIANGLYAPESAVVKIYSYEHNTAIPQDATGKVVGNTLAFYPQSDPAQGLNVGADLTFTTTVAPGKYIVSVDVKWLVPDQFPQLKGALHTQYVFNLEVV